MDNNFINDDNNIYSHSFEELSSTSEEYQNKKHKKRKKKGFKRFCICILSLLLVFVIIFGVYSYNLINKISRQPLEASDLGIDTDYYSSVKNIALLGIDSREDNKVGRCDANVILTIDKKHNKIKLTSIARDSYVAIDGRGKDKLTHAYAYGKSQLAVKTLNRNYGLEITDYVTMNFFGLARVVDYIGGVELDVDDREFEELNSYVIPTTDFGDIACNYLETSGIQTLTGAQAVCYARIRHTDSDIERGNRQKEVLSAIFAKIKKTNPLKFPKLASLILNECETSLSTDDIISLAASILIIGDDFEQLSIPNDNITSSGKMINGIWYYVYDLEKASEEISKFILEIN